MTTPKLSHHISKFSEKIRAMNDTNSKQLVLSAAEARSLHTDIFTLLAKIAELSDKSVEVDVGPVVVSGGKFKN